MYDVFLLNSGPEIRDTQEILRQRFLKGSFSKRKLWFGAPKLPKFNRRFGIVQNAPLLSEVDYTSCYEMMEQFPSEIQELSMKSMLNKITQRESRVFIFKGPPACGKSELISRVCTYWAKQYALREFFLVFYVNIWDLHRGCTLLNLIDRQLKDSTVSSERICRWIEEEKGNGILFILDGFCRKYFYRSPLRKGEMLFNILSGFSSFSKSTIVISTSCSDFVKPLCENFTQFEILGLSEEQIGKEAIQHFENEGAFNFLSYLAENPEIKGLASSPSYLIATIYVFAHISYNDLPVTWTQLYTSLVGLINEWHKRDLSKEFHHDSLQTKFKNRFLKMGRKINRNLPTNSLQSQFMNTLLEYSRKIINDSGDLMGKIGKVLIHDADDCDHELPDHNSAVPCLDYFLFSLATLDHKKLCKALKDDEDALAHFWYKKNVLKMLSGYVTAEQQVLSSLTAKICRTVVTTCDIHSLLHCLPYMQDPHTLILDRCCLGIQAVRELSRFLAADSWANNSSGISHLW